ncbi:MAG: hypothetical protein KAT61_09690 [Gammaproteobacteria bacterium]|nr:hypothetical protein [Gammaproteobacteria bacterium]
MNSNLKNILIVFDAAGYTPVAMQTVVELAVSSQTGIQALYIEDSNLLNAVELPFTREVSLHTAEISSIDSTLMMQKLRTDAESIKKQIEKIAVTRSVSLSFSSMRGQKTQIIKSRREEVNMVLIPAVYSTAGRKQQHHLKHVVAMVYENHNLSNEKALNIALSQAAKNSYLLFVIVDSQHSKQHVEQLISQQSADVTYQVAVCQIAGFSSVDEVVLLLQKHSPGLLVLTEGSRLIANEQGLQQLINSLESDILLVR